MQNFSQAIRQTWRAKNFRKEQKRLARILMSGDGQKTAAQFRIGGKLFGAGIEPRVDLGVHSTERGLQLRRVAFRVVHQKTWIDAEEARQQRARAMREMRPCAALDLREVGLAKAAAYFLLHGLRQLLLRHRTPQAAQGTFHGAERTEFVAESHRRTHLLQSANTILFIAISVKNYIRSVFNTLRELLLPDGSGAQERNRQTVGGKCAVLRFLRRSVGLAQRLQINSE